MTEYPIDNPWAALAAVATVICPLVLGEYFRRKSRRDDEAKDDAQPALDQAQKGADLLPAVNALADRVSELEKWKQYADPIVSRRYPAALGHIKMVHLDNPELEKRIPIPVILRADMEE